MANTVTATWDNTEQTIVRFDFADDFTWDDAYHAKDDADRLINESAYKGALGVIFATSPNVRMPRNVLSATRNGLTKKHPRVVAIALVTQNSFTRIMYNTLVKIVPGLAQVYHHATTLDEARMLLNAKIAETQDSGQAVS